MKSIANRMIVFAVSTIAFGTVAFGQTRMTVEVPFAFRTPSGTLPAGNYQISQQRGVSMEHAVYLMNTASKKGVVSLPLFDAWQKTGERKPWVDFACVAGNCMLKAIHTVDGELLYPSPRKSKHDRESLALVSIPLKISNGD